MSLQAKLIQHKQIEAKYGPCFMSKAKVLRTGEDITIFSKTSDRNAQSKTEGQIITVSKNDKGKWIFSNNVEQQSNEGLTHISEPLERIVDELNLPRLSPNQKRELAKYIQQQSNLFKHITDTVSSTMPDLKSNDHRAIAMSIFIDVQKRIN